MITRIEINGFKSFHNFKVNLRPFQVFIGPNGVGKTNLFDAIVLLSHLAGDNTVADAFRQSRGEIAELFTYFPDGTRAKLMSFAVDAQREYFAPKRRSPRLVVWMRERPVRLNPGADRSAGHLPRPSIRLRRAPCGAPLSAFSVRSRDATAGPPCSRAEVG